MDMVLIYMGADDKGMVSFCELQRQLPADLIGFFRRNFAGLKYRGSAARTYPYGFMCSSSGRRKQIRKTFFRGSMFFYQRPAHICNLIHKRCCRQFAMFHLFQHGFPFCS
ncbi:Uncharacterised protein [Alistipes sp. cv1]|nr:Uncharacterised protein [Faecalibacterium prausnitzii]